MEYIIVWSYLYLLYNIICIYDQNFVKCSKNFLRNDNRLNFSLNVYNNRSSFRVTKNGIRELFFKFTDD